MISRTPPDLRLPRPRVGEHRDAVLHDYGFSNEEIRALAAEGAGVSRLVTPERA